MLVTFPPGTLRPLPPPIAGIICSACRRPGARWEVAVVVAEDALFYCSSCVLFNSPFTRLPSMKDLPDFIARVEAALGRPLAVDETGRLQGPDADRIVFSIVLMSSLRDRS